MPNRILKESICTSESIDQLKPFEETFFYRLIVSCDDYGRMDARPRILKSKLFPLRDSITLKNVEDGLRVLATVGLVALYESDGRPFLQLPTWEAHQQVRAKKSKYPAPANICNQLISDDRNCPRNPIQSESVSESVSNTTTTINARAEDDPRDENAELRRDATALHLAISEVEVAAKGIGLPFEPTDEEAATQLIATYTAPWVLEAIRRAADRPGDKRSWGYVKGILRNFNSQGGPDDARRPAGRDSPPYHGGQRDGGHELSALGRSVHNL